ncbi:hypothetical protein PIIN_01610 [Serendipita indica DSM 11827]|uniref:Uncharacterized protein n=1 Tax=Serendipita indica (strain DSM 11827) TaxID=1109443 RepID=G4T8X3_SERID|nr:hypothetical protein PIIN_01610 [Serendipita indica DSM 11827]
MRSKLAPKVLRLPKSQVSPTQIIQPIQNTNVRLTVAQTLSIRLGQPITANPSCLHGLSARRNQTSSPITLREPTPSERIMAFQGMKNGASQLEPPSNLRVVDIEDWDRRLFKRMAPAVRKRVQRTYFGEK